MGFFQILQVSKILIFPKYIVAWWLILDLGAIYSQFDSDPSAIRRFPPPSLTRDIEKGEKKDKDKTILPFSV